MNLSGKCSGYNYCMNDKYTALISYMLNHPQKISAAALSDALGFSVRSVKNYIYSINSFANAKVINSSRDGYSINESLAKKLLIIPSNSNFQSYEQRAQYILRCFLFDHRNNIDVGSFSDEMFVSESTLKSDIKKLNKTCEIYSIAFRISNNLLSLEGSERNFRTFISSTIYSEIDNNYININTINDYFPSFNSSEIKDIVLNTFNDYDLYINDIALTNIVLHIAIIIDRLIDGKNVTYDTNGYKTESLDDVTVALCKKLEATYSISLIADERREIEILIKANVNYVSIDNLSNLSEYIGSELLDMVNYIVEAVEKDYMVDLSSQHFIIPFALHLHNLSFRYKEQKSIINPMAYSIMTSYPIVSDIAVFISMVLSDKYGIHCNQDEISFLALHVGGEIERQKCNQDKVTTILLCPSYMNLETRLLNNLMMAFNDEINIIKTLRSAEQIDEYQFQLLISTVKVKPSEKYEIVLVAPFASRLNKTEIQNKIDRCRDKEKHAILRQHFDDYFEKDLFFTNQQDIHNAEDAIAFISEKLLDKEYVDESFPADVLERESAASTAFNCVAIPHSIKETAYKTSISVLIMDDGIDWHGQRINIVLMLSLSHYESNVFYNLYEALALLFSNYENTDLFKSCKTFSEFRTSVFSLVQ